MQSDDDYGTTAVAARTPYRRTRPSVPSHEADAKSFHFDDLDAEVHARVDPHQYAVELDALYSSLFATVDWFETHDDAPWMGACLLEGPRHVLLFTGKSDTVELLNKAFVIAPADVERAFRALFRAFPHVRRIRVEVMFPPSELHGPKLVLLHVEPHGRGSAADRGRVPRVAGKEHAQDAATVPEPTGA